MKKISWKALFVLVTVFSLLCTSIVWAQPRWSHLTYIGGDIDIDDSNNATVTVIVDASSKDADSLKVTCALQQLKNSSWKTIKSWTESADDTGLIMEEEYAVYKGYSYRLKVTAKAYNGSTLKETVTEYFNYGYYN